MTLLNFYFTTEKIFWNTIHNIYYLLFCFVVYLFRVTKNQPHQRDLTSLFYLKLYQNAHWKKTPMPKIYFKPDSYVHQYNFTNAWNKCNVMNELYYYRFRCLLQRITKYNVMNVICGMLCNECYVVNVM